MNIKSFYSIPVALFAYKRPEHLKQTLYGLEVNKVPLIYAFCDGPRKDDDYSSIEKVRQIIKKIDWCDVRIYERTDNLGLGSSIRNGVSKVLENHDKVIVVEDDIILRPGAYQYTVSALKKYEDDQRVMTISMWNHPAFIPDNVDSGFFAKRFVCWGWGTYKSDWAKYIGTPPEIYRKCLRQNLDVLAWGKDIEWQVTHSIEKNLWYIGYALIHFLYNKVSYFPEESLTVNIGRDGTGENTGRSGIQDDISLLKKSVTIPSKWPKVQMIDGLEKKFSIFFSPKKRNLFQRLKRLASITLRKINRIYPH